MMNQRFTASKTRSNRPGWSVTFKHPKRSDSRGNPGLKVRRGLGTQNENEADRLVSQLNELLSDESWWSVDRKKEAAKLFDKQVVDAFFDGMEAGRINSRNLRESVMALPSHSDGYSRVLFAGTTGAGKTTLLRHLIGSSHHEDRFPSTSTARTTTADIEVITAEGPFEAVVTFMADHEVRAHVDECLEEACERVIQGRSPDKVMEALLFHREQRFRLSYVLGPWEQGSEINDDDFAFEEDDFHNDKLDEGERVSVDEREDNRNFLRNCLQRINAISKQVSSEISEKLESFENQKGPEERAAWLELFGERVFENDDFSRLALDLIEKIEDRFNYIESGEFTKKATGWPITWRIRSDNRQLFLKQIRWFSSNHRDQFGRLLTPLVDGIRARGPFLPRVDELDVAPKLVLIDGEGIGHSSKSASSISTRITQRYAEVDLILLVDSAEQPMQTAPLELLRSLGSSGYADKLAVAFTHFDLVRGPNLGSFQSKRDHVLSSVRDALGNIRESVGLPVAELLEKRVESCAFFLGGLDRESSKIPKGILGQLKALLQLMRQSGKPDQRSEAKPIYTGEGLETALRDAVEGFLSPWRARLGKSYHEGFDKEHWTRVKALARRFAMQWNYEYDDLRPVADLVARLQESISRWLDNPTDWDCSPSDNAESGIALGKIRKAVFTELHKKAESRLAELQVQNWTQAFEFSGPGSSFKRATQIEAIYETAAPPINSAMDKHSREFLHELYHLVRQSVSDSGGRFDASRER